MAGLSREKNPNWKGGRTVTSHGYVLILVGKDHPLADVRGYAYEHRLVAEQATGESVKGKIVHHEDTKKQNNTPGNLVPCNSIAEHLAKHRKPGSRLRLPGQPNESILCACGCGTSLMRFDGQGRPRSFVSGHNTTHSELAVAVLAALPTATTAAELSKLLNIKRRLVTIALGQLKRAGNVARCGLKWSIAKKV